jgi:MFS family permease
MDRYFDLIYYALAIGILLALVYSIISALDLRRSSVRPAYRQPALGIIWIALGTAITLLGGLFADSFLKNSPYFQQTRFALYDVGFVLIVVGITTILAAAQVSDAQPNFLSNLKQLRSVVWVLFLGSLAISTFYLLNPATFVLNQYGYQIQQAVYFLPMLTAVLVGSVLLLLAAFASRGRAARLPFFWLGLFAALVFVGLLRESLILPDLGDPLIDLLAAFVPFFMSSICLGFASASFRRLAA